METFHLPATLHCAAGIAWPQSWLLSKETCLYFCQCPPFILTSWGRVTLCKILRPMAFLWHWLVLYWSKLICFLSETPFVVTRQNITYITVMFSKFVCTHILNLYQIELCMCLVWHIMMSCIYLVCKCYVCFDPYCNCPLWN